MLFVFLDGSLTSFDNCQNLRTSQKTRHRSPKNGKQEVFALQCWQACQLRVTVTAGQQQWLQPRTWWMRYHERGVGPLLGVGSASPWLFCQSLCLFPSSNGLRSVYFLLPLQCRVSPDVSKSSLTYICVHLRMFVDVCGCFSKYMDMSLCMRIHVALRHCLCMCW